MLDHKAPFEASPGASRPGALGIKINGWDDIPRAIAVLQLAGTPGAEGRVVCLQALYRGLIAHLDVNRATSSGEVKRFIAGVRLPAVVLVGDDDDAPTGPAGFKPAQRLLAWAHHVVIHGAAGDPEHYRAAVIAAQVTGRLLLIECVSKTIPAWQAAARKWATGAVVQVLQPPPGQSHPTPVPASALQ